MLFVFSLSGERGGNEREYSRTTVTMTIYVRWVKEQLVEVGKKYSVS
jgi:hypothetical protein